MSDWQPADAEARRLAIETSDANVVVLAGAGTGKTTLLVERVLFLVIECGVPIDELAAITFTEKATAEMRGRIGLALDELAALAGGLPPDNGGSAASRAWQRGRASGRAPSDLRDRALGALAALDRTQVSTIHGFCADLLRAFPVESGLDPGFRIDPGPEAAARFGPLWDDFLVRELGATPRREALWSRLIAGGWLPLVRGIADELHRTSLGSVETGPVDARALLAPIVERALALGRSLRARQTGLAGAPLQFLDQALAALDFWMRFGSERFQAEMAGRGRIPGRNDDRSAPAPGARLGGVSKEEMKAGLRHLHKVLRLLAEHDEPACDDLLAAAAPVAAEQAEEMRRAGVVGYDGLLLRARDLLRDHPAVRAALRRRWRHLLVDEFQDTDPLQYEIVLFLGEAEGEPASDPFATRLLPGRLFIVGDPKQSIYRFRGADLAAFGRVARHLAAQGALSLDLTQNFRSGARLIEAVNRLFGPGGRWASEGTPTGAMVSDEVQPPYVPILGLPESAAGGSGPAGSAPPVELWTIPDPGDAWSRRRCEGEAIAAAIPALIDEIGATPGEVTLLLRAFTDVASYLRPLREAGIPFIVDGGREFMRRAEVGQLLALARAVTRLADPVPLLATLRAPIGGVSDRELADWADAGGRWDARIEPDEGRFPLLAAAFARLRSLAAGIRALAPEQALRRLAADSGLLELSAASFEGAQRLANLERLIEAAARLGQQGHLPLAPLLDALEARPGEELESDAPLADEDALAVRVLTIHRAKGLENRIVILADLARAEGSPHAPPILRPARFSGLPPTHAIRTEGRLNAAAIRLEIEARRQEEAEEARLLYVAVTRARQRLILIAGRPGRGRTPWLEALRAWGYDPDSPPEDGALLAGDLVRHRLVSQAPPVRSAPPPLPDTTVAVAAWRTAHAAAQEATRRPLTRTPSAAPEPSALSTADSGARDSAASAGAPAGSADRDLARAVGIAVHRVLEARTGSASEDEALLTRAARRAALETGQPEAGVEAEARAILRAFAGSPLADRLASATVLAREIPLLLDAGDGAVWHGSLDLLYRDDTGRLCVADFKTDRDPSGAEARYGGQLAIYGEAVRRALGLAEPPILELWLLREGRRLTLDAAGRPGGSATPSS